MGIHNKTVTRQACTQKETDF